MRVSTELAIVLLSLAAVQLCTAQSETSLPTITPTIFDPDAPQPQSCPGYTASNVVQSGHGLTADLTLAGAPCNVFGNEINDLILEVSYQAKGRLNVKIQPKYIGATNQSWFLLDDQFLRIPEWDGQTTQKSSDLKFTWSNDPTFQFAVSRASDDEEIFSTFGHVIVYEDQFIELETNMVDDYNVYGLAENIRNFRLGTNYTQTLFNADSADAIDENAYGTHPFYQETRYREGQSSTAHGVYGRNAHAQEWLMRETTLTYRAIGGMFDLYFLSGQPSHTADHTSASSSALEVIRQYQQGCVGLPAMQQYWTFGFHQSHWGYSSISDLQDVIANYSAAGIPLETIWNDIDVYDQYRIFTNDPVHYPSSEMHDFVDYLHSRGQHYVVIQDSNVYFPDPSNATDVASYPPFTRGAGMNAFTRDASTGYFYIGENWPGYSVWNDWLVPESEEFWTSEVAHFHDLIPFDGVWVDLNEPQSFCSLSCGNQELTPTQLTAANPRPNADSRKLNFPAYRINNAKPSKQIIEQTIALNAFHNDEYHSREYDAHDLFSIGVCKATYNAIESIIPGKRPFIIVRSTFIGAGQYVGHWGGDNEAKWGAMFLSISQSFIFQMAGIPMFGVDTCGFAENTTEELCTRWMELSAFFPFYRNHYADGKRSQEAYVWATTAEASRRAISTRYSLLSYIYTLFHYAHARGDTVMRALAWEFPDDFSLRATDTQFLLGPSLLITPVLEPNATKVRGVFPGVGEETRWYDWYTLEEIKDVQPQENVTMQAPLEHINVHVRGGSILPIQEPGNTTAMTKSNPYSLLIALDANESAHGTLYLDDGESIEPSETKMVEFSYMKGQLIVRSWGRYHTTAPLANITFVGMSQPPSYHEINVRENHFSNMTVDYGKNTLRMTGLDEFTSDGAWRSDLMLRIW